MTTHSSSPQRSKRFFILWSSLVLALFIIAGIWIGMQPHRKHHLMPPIAVVVAPVVTKALPIEWEMPGTIEALQSVSVRTQITGTIKKIDFVAGQNVTAEQLLFEIDPAPFEVSLQQVQANLTRDQAQAEASTQNEQRFAPLAKQGYVSRQQYEQVRSTAEMQTAIVKADQEQVRQAEIKLGYAQIRAPISGKTGDVIVKEGDLVTAGNDTPLVTINQLNPVLVDFDLPETKLPKLLAHQQKNPLKAEVWTEKGNQLLSTGQLTFIDNTVNNQTGTVLLKASVSNPNDLLWPGLMVSVKLILTIEPNAIVIPTQAVRIDQNGHFVYQIKNDRVVVQRIVIGHQMDNLTEVKQGLSQGEQVITVAPPNLGEGKLVTVIPSSNIPLSTNSP